MPGSVGSSCAWLSQVGLGEPGTDDTIEGAVDERAPNRHDSPEVARGLELASERKSVRRLFGE